MPDTPSRPRRSVLYLPASNSRALDKARQLEADSIIIDLEDSVAPQAKGPARQQVLEALRAGGFGNREVVVRVNALDTPWGEEDLAMVAATPADAVLLPKINQLDDIRQSESVLKANACAPQMQLWMMAETALGILNLPSLCASGGRLTVVVMGTNDLARELRVEQSPGQEALLHCLSQAVLAARAYGLDVIDGVYNAIHDEAGLIESCQQGRRLGFDGKTLIHPSQLAVANRIFSPLPEQLAWARKITAAWQNERADNVAVITVDGKLVEELHVRQAQQLLAVQAAIDERSTG